MALHVERLDTVALSRMQPILNLGPRLPMHLVHLSNMKLNAQIFSSRSLSIQRRILIKNFLTVLYQLHPVNLIEQSPVDGQDQWMENTLSAVGIGQTDALSQEYEYGYDYCGHGCDYTSTLLSSENTERTGTGYGSSCIDEPILSPAAAAAASAVTLRRRPQSLRSSNVPLPRPVSMELPVALQSYLSTVFDVDWSVDLASKEDSLFTSKPALYSPLRSTLAPSALALNQVAFSDLASVSSSPSPQSHSTGTLSASHGHHSDHSQTQPCLRECPGQDYNSNPYSGKSEYEENKQSTGSSHSQQSQWQVYSMTGNYSSSSSNQAQHVASSPSHTIQARQEKQLPPSSGQLTATDKHDSTSYRQEPGHQTHVHNHFHIHIHNYPSDGSQSSPRSTASSDRLSNLPPVVRSLRYPKQQQHMMTLGTHSSTPEDTHGSLSYLDFPAPPTTQPYATSAAIAVAGPLASPLSSTPLSTPPSSGMYPPEKTSMLISATEEEQPYLATAPPVSSLYMRSPPPPPYTQSSEDASSLVYGQAPYSRALKSDPIPSIYTSILSTKPQLSLSFLTSSSSSSSLSFSSSVSSSSSSSSSLTNTSNQKLIEYKQYQERQKMFVKDDDSRDARPSDGLGFIKQLFRQGSKKRSTGVVISAPLPSTSSLLINTHTPFLLHDLVKQPSIRQSRAA